MKKGRCKVLLFIAVILLLTGCSSVANEKKIQSDLETNTQFDFLNEGEKIEKLEIEKRQTDKKQKADTIWCTITTADTEVSYQKSVVLTYNLYDKGGWTLDDVSVNKSKEWIKTPLKGIADEKILSSLNGEYITVNEEKWEITKDNISNFSIDKHDTNLEEKTDTVTASLTINADVEEAKGQLVINYIFDDKWKIDTLSDNAVFTATVKPEAALNVTEDDLMNEIVNQGFQYGGSKPDKSKKLTLIDNRSQQTVTVNKSQLSDFKINNQESSSKGSSKKYFCSGILTTAHVVFDLNAEIEYKYKKNDGWNMKSVTIIPEVASVNIEGDWTGTYRAAGDRGKVTLSITDVSDDGTISGVYSWTPEELTIAKQPGSYYVSGTMDKDRLLLDLKAGEWITKPEKALYVTKVDIKTQLYIDDSKMQGTGHESSSITVSQ